MIDINKLRDDADLCQQKWQERNCKVDAYKLQEQDKNWRKLISLVDEKRSQRKKASENIHVLQKNKEDATSQIQATKELSKEIKALEEEISALEQEIKTQLLSLPNLHHESVPVGKSEDDNVFIREWGTKGEYDFKLKDHLQLGEELSLIDFPRAAKLSGANFSLVSGDGSRLKRALVQWFLDEHRKQDYREYSVPYLVNRATMTNTGQLPKFEEDLYKVSCDDLFLIPTAEVPVTNIYANEIISQDNLPLYLTSHTPCFRREAGAHGKENKGMIRLHQFDKVEIVKIVDQESSYQELELLLTDAENLLQQLGLHYRVIELCSSDLGFSAAKCYDIEVWAPALERYLEVSSCSNFEDFQARRAQIRYRDNAKDKPKYAHTLNGSALALPRCLIALIETYQNEDGSITIPDVLVPYMDGQEIIERK